MKQILLFGAGKSATVLIDYLISHAKNELWNLVVVDTNLQLAADKIKGSPYGRAVSFDVMDTEKRSEYIEQSAVVISMLPPSLHYEVAKDCIRFSKHLLTASYVDDQLRKMSDEIKNKNLLFLCEMGLDPGIDHMSAMKLIDEIQADGGTITSFRSHCGGLVAPESDDNPWHYKISWNPRNIVMAGKAGAHYREDGEEKRLSHEELFTAHNTVDVPGLGQLSWYPNRDSLSYTSLYELEDIPTFVRTTLRHPDFMLGWKHVIELNLTDESPQYNSDGKSLGEVYKQHLDKNGFAEWLTKNQAELTLKQLLYLGLDDRHTKLNKGMMSPADLLQFSLEKKLALETGDRDMIVMLHEIGSTTGNIRSSLVVKGEDNRYTAMAKTVGLPLAIAAKLILNGRLTLTGLQIPTSKEIYYPVLKELAEYGISFHEEKTALA